MAETGSPQFVVARSAISCNSGALCLLAALTLGIARGRSLVVGPSAGYDREMGGPSNGFCTFSVLEWWLEPLLLCRDVSWLRGSRCRRLSRGVLEMS